MNLKVIGIGNRIMMDDSIGVRLTEGLKDWMEKQGIQVIIGETDAENCLYQIMDEEDFLIILDATLFGLEPGTITLQVLTSFKPNCRTYAQHDSSIIELLYTHGRKNKGYIIGIEVGTIGFGLDLSEVLQLKYDTLLEKVRKLIENVLEECEMHDSFLFENITKEVFSLCDKNQIKRLTHINISVYKDSHVNEKSLYLYLQSTNNPLVGAWTKVAVAYDNPKCLTAIIEHIEGE